MKKIVLCLLLCVAVLATSIGGAMMEVCANVDVSETKSLQSAGLVDFVVEVEAGRDIRVLQLTDPQIIAGEYQRYAERGTEQWSHAEEDKHEKYVEQIITRYNPDFIIVTGDVIYGEFDDSGASLLRYIKFMDSFQIPWAPVAGNHDWESSMGADWMCQQYEKSEYCLFKQRTLSGNGNYTVGLQQDGKLQRVFFMLDSNGCVNASKASLANGHTPTSFGFQQDQISWYTEVANTIKTQSPDTKISFAFHIQINAFALAMAKYGTVGDVIDIDAHPDKESTDFGYMGRGLKSNWDTDNTVFNGLKALGVDSVFVGHEHCNSASVVYEGVRLQYGQKSSTYDRANYIQADGTIVGTYDDAAGEPIVGGTVIPVSELDGSIVDPCILYYDPDYGKDASNSQVFDFNGQDFDMTVTTPDVKDRGNAATLSDTAAVPAGFTDSVALASDGYLNAVGVKFPADINFEHINSIKLRVYISSYGVTTGKTPLIRLYDSESNSIFAELKVESRNFGQWVDIELYSLFESAKNVTTIVNDGVLQPFTLVYRTYSATQESSPIYFDSLIIESTDDIYTFPEISEGEESTTRPTHTDGNYDGQKYARFTLSSFGYDEIDFSNENKVVVKTGKEAMSINFIYYPTTSGEVNFKFATDKDGNGGYNVNLNSTGFSIYNETNATFNYNFTEGEAYNVEIGFVKMEANPVTGEYNGNQAYMFLKVNGDIGSTDAKGKYYHIVDIYPYKNNEYLTISTTATTTDKPTLETDDSIPFARKFMFDDGSVLMQESRGKYVLTASADNGYELKAGSLLVKDVGGNYFVPERVGFREGGNASQYKVPENAVAPYTVEADFYQPTIEDINMGLVGYSYTDAQGGGLRFIHRLNVTKEGDKLYMMVDGANIEVKEYGLLLAAQTVVRDPEDLDIETANDSMHVQQYAWPETNLYYDYCDEYVDIAVHITGIETAGGGNINIITRTYVELADGTVIYGTPAVDNYNAVRGM